MRSWNTSVNADTRLTRPSSKDPPTRAAPRPPTPRHGPTYTGNNSAAGTSHLQDAPPKSTRSWTPVLDPVKVREPHTGAALRLPRFSAPRHLGGGTVAPLAVEPIPPMCSTACRWVRPAVVPLTIATDESTAPPQTQAEAGHIGDPSAPFSWVLPLPFQGRTVFSSIDVVTFRRNTELRTYFDDGQQGQDDGNRVTRQQEGEDKTKVLLFGLRESATL